MSGHDAAPARDAAPAHDAAPARDAAPAHDAAPARDAAPAHDAAPRTGPAVILIGPPGAGKTTIARALGERTGRATRDTDDDVEQVAGRSVSEIFTKLGEPEFRRLEREAVAAAVAEHIGILSLGGGAVMDEETRALLADQPVAYLSLTMSVGVKRTGMSDRRPMFIGMNPRRTFKALLEARVPVYREVASVEIDTDDKTVDQVTDAVIVEFGLDTTS